MKNTLLLFSLVAAIRGCQVPPEEGTGLPPPEPAQSAASAPTAAQPAETPAPTPAQAQMQTKAPEVVSEKPKEAPTMSFLHTRGRDIVDAQDKPVRLRGCNIGNWLLIEPWMLCADGQTGCGSEKEIWDLVSARFGKQAKLDLIKAHRRNFFTEKDVARIADMGLNCIRLPIWWRAISDPEYGGDIAWIDRCVEWCGRHGIYVIIDMHGPPGGPSMKAVIVGEPNQNELWTDDAYKKRTVDLWKQIAARYKDSPVVAGYDLLNEPTDAPFDDLIAFYDTLYKEIRAIDPKHMIMIQDGFQGFHRLPLKKDMGWDNIVYSFHYYPQTAEESTQAASTIIPRFNRTAINFDAPLYVGEFNTILLERGGADIFLRLCEVFDYYDWAWTFWSYKKPELSRDANWAPYGYVTGTRLPDFNKDSFNDLLAFFQGLETSHLPPIAMLETALRQPVRWQDPAPAEPGVIKLSMRDAFVLPGPKGGAHMEWGLAQPNVGFWAYGDTVTWRIISATDGVYELVLRLASGQEDCPVQIWLDGVRVGNVPQKGTGGWDKYEDRSIARLKLTAGRHTLDIALAERGQGINLCGGSLRPSTEAPLVADESAIWLRPANVEPFREKSPIRVEWLSDPPHFGFWTSGEKVSWKIRLAAGGQYKSQVTYATPTKATHLTLIVDGQPLPDKELPDTGDWSKFATADTGTLNLKPGDHVIEAMWKTTASFGAGNLREFKFQKSTGP